MTQTEIGSTHIFTNSVNSTLNFINKNPDYTQDAVRKYFLGTEQDSATRKLFTNYFPNIYECVLLEKERIRMISAIVYNLTRKILADNPSLTQNEASTSVVRLVPAFATEKLFLILFPGIYASVLMEMKSVK